MNYVTEYLRLDKRAAVAEVKAEEYRAKAEEQGRMSKEDRYECCHVAFEAISDGYTRKGFSEAVGVSRQTIGRQVNIWAKYGEVAAELRPSYYEAILEEPGESPIRAGKLVSDPNVQEELAKMRREQRQYIESIPLDERKASEAAMGEYRDAIRHFTDPVDYATTLLMIEEATKGLRTINERGSITSKFMEKLSKAIDDLMIEVAEARFRVEA